MSDSHHIATYAEVLTYRAPARTGEYEQITTIIHPHEPPNKQDISHFLKVSGGIREGTNNICGRQRRKLGIVRLGTCLRSLNFIQRSCGSQTNSTRLAASALPVSRHPSVRTADVRIDFWQHPCFPVVFCCHSLFKDRLWLNVLSYHQQYTRSES